MNHSKPEYLTTITITYKLLPLMTFKAPHNSTVCPSGTTVMRK